MNHARAALRGGAVALALLIAAACAPGTGRAPQRHEIEIRNFLYEPPDLTVAVGDTVVWKDDDIVPHTATARDSTWDSGPIVDHQSWSYVATKPGTYPYGCTFHPEMTGTLVVK